MAIDISFEEIKKWARFNAINEDREWYKAFGRACSGLKRQLAAVMNKGGGVNGVPKFRDYEDFTRELRALRGVAGKMGGVLAERGNIVAFKRNGAQIIGWPDGMERVVEAFQDGAGGDIAEAQLADEYWRKRLHQHGIRIIPRSYAHNPRPVLEPYFHDHVKLNLNDWAEKIYFKQQASRMMKSKGFVTK